MKGWRCPNCGTTNRLEVVVRVWACLEQTLEQTLELGVVESENKFQTCVDDHDHEWDGASDMACEECGWRGEAKDAEFTMAPEGCLGVVTGRKPGGEP